jgi:hypothetical protein
METQATKTVKDKSAPDSVEDECDHMLSDWLDEPDFEGSLDPKLHARIKRTCEEVFKESRQATHPDEETLKKEVIRRFGRWLHHCKDRELRAIVINLLIEASRVKNETDRGEM